VKEIKNLELCHELKTRKRVMGSAAHEPALKKARTFSVTPLSVEINGFSNGNGVGGQDQTNGDLDCRRFGTPEGCPYGNKCRFKHGPAGKTPCLSKSHRPVRQFRFWNSRW